MKSRKIFTIYEICPTDRLKAKKIVVTKAVSLLFAILCFLRLKFGLMNFVYQQLLGRAQICSTVQQILENSTEGNAINLARKIPIFFVAKHYVME